MMFLFQVCHYIFKKSISFFINSKKKIASSRLTYIRIRGLPYDDLLDDYIMTITLTQDIPNVFSKALDMSVDNFIVVSIGKSSSNSDTTKPQKRSDNIAVIVTMAVPPEVVNPLQKLVSQTDSQLYKMDLGQLPSMIDPMYPVESKSGNLIYSYPQKKIL